MVLFACVAVGGLLVFWGLPKLYIAIQQALKRG